MARARRVSGLHADVPFAEAAAKVVTVRAAELIEHSAGVLDTTDIERVHDMRVATRRLRAALEVFAPCFPRKRFKRALRDVKRLADALGERRDRDVAIADLLEVRAAADEAERPGIASMIEQLRHEQAEANTALAPYVAADRLAKLHARLDALGARG